MLYNGEEVGSGEGPEVDVAVDPLEGTRLCGARPAERDRRDRRRRARHDVLSGRGLLHGEDRRRPARDRRDRHHEVADRERAAPSPRRSARSPREVDVVVLERDRHDALIDELREAGARVRLIRDGDVAPAIAAARPGTGVDMLYGIGGTPEGVHLGGRAEVRRRRHPGPALAAERRGAASARRERARSRPRAAHGRSRLGRRRLRRRDRRHDRRAAERRVVQLQRARDRLDRHALALGHGAPRVGDALAREARPR